MSGQAQPATCERCRIVLIPPDAVKRQLVSRETVELCDFHAQVEALLKALGAVVRDESSDGHSQNCPEFLRNPFTIADDCCGERIARAAIAAARPHAAAGGGTRIEGRFKQNA